MSCVFFMCDCSLNYFFMGEFFFYFNKNFIFSSFLDIPEIFCNAIDPSK